jgi:hypothetical protein
MILNDKFTKDAVIPCQLSLLLLFIESSLYFVEGEIKTDSFQRIVSKVEVEVVEIVTYATSKYLPLAVK